MINAINTTIENNDNKIVINNNIFINQNNNSISTNKIDPYFINNNDFSSNNNEDTHKIHLLKEDILTGYWQILFGILTIVFLFGIGYIFVGAKKIKKAKQQMKTFNIINRNKTSLVI